jgi:plastocyanin
MRPAVLIAIFAAGAGAAVVPALAADQTVDTTSDNKFKPATVTVSVGDQVTFRDGVTGGYHNVHFADGPGNAPHFGPWSYSRRFTKSGRYPFVCDIHVNSGMRGEVVVLGPDGSVPPASPPPGSPPPPAPPPAPAAAPSFSVRALHARFCARGCAHPGIVLRIALSEPATVSGRLERRSQGGGFRGDGRVRFRIAAAGRHTVTIIRRVNGRRIDAGDYRLTLRARAAAGRSSAARVVSFAVR